MIESKIKFPKKTEVLTAKELGLDYDGIEFEFWSDPGKPVVGELMRIVLWTSNDELQQKTIDEQRKDAKTYFRCVSEIITDCNIAGSSFDTPEETEKTFELPDVAWGFWYDVVAAYLVRLIEVSSNLKKVRSALQSLTNSGNDSKSEPEEK